MNPATQRLDSARKLLASGRTRDALALLAQNTKEFPRDADSVYLSGVCHARTGDYATAEKYFSKAVKLNRDLFQAYSDLGLSQSRQKKFSQAIKSFKQALAKNPGLAPAHSHLALAYLQGRQQGKALKHARQAVALDGNNPQFLNVQALCYRELGQSERAIETFQRISTEHPAFYGAIQNLHETYRMLGDNTAAERTLLQARESFGNRAELYLTLGRFYEQTNRAIDARDLYAEGMGKCAGHIDLVLALGRANRLLGRIGEGLEQVTGALRLDPGYQPALAERSAFHVLQGEYDEAYALLNSFVASHPDESLTPGLATAYAHACRLTGRYEESIETLRNTLQGPGLPDEMRSVIHHAMGDSHDRLKNYKRAFSSYRKANDIGAQASDIERYLGIMDGIGRSIRAGELDEADLSDVTSSKPVFIVGMPRSGTSLVEQILASHPEVHGAGEITELWSISQDISESVFLENYAEKLASLDKDSLNRHAGRYLSYLESLDPDASRVTDKLPHNFMHIELIRKLFRGARIIHCHRHPFDTCLSIYFKKFNNNHLYARNLSDIARFYKGYVELMALWRDTPTDILSLKYEDLVNDPEELSRGIVAHVGLEWDDRCLRYYETDRLVATPSYTQANRPVYPDAVHRWKNYRAHLGPLVDILGDPGQYE